MENKTAPKKDVWNLDSTDPGRWDFHSRVTDEHDVLPNWPEVDEEIVGEVTDMISHHPIFGFDISPSSNSRFPYRLRTVGGYLLLTVAQVERLFGQFVRYAKDNA